MASTLRQDTLETWISRAGAVRCTPEQREAIAKLCLEAERRGDKVNSVWHQSAQYFGYPERCNCYPCRVQAGYDPVAVNRAIESSNRSGRKIGGREAKAIHALLKGRA